MYIKLFALIAVFALFGVALADFSANIQLKVFEDSSNHWLAVDPTNDNDDTIRIDMLESNSDSWVRMSQNVEFGYWQLWSSSPAGFALPLSFRLTSVDGEQVILDNILATVAAGELETPVQFARSARANGHNGGHNGNSGSSEESSADSSSAGRTCPTARPTQGPTSTPTTAPTTAPVTAAPTSAPTQHATQPATHAPTSAPTQHGGHSSGSSSPVTAAPTTKPTSAPTSAPTQHGGHSGSSSTPVTAAPTSAPTTKPSSSGSASSGSSSTDLCAITSTATEPVKILVPLYQEPGKDWDSLITAANAGASIIAIINPDNGPVSSGPPSNWVTYMNKMKAANIDMVGYVATGYAGNAISDMESQIDTYFNKYTGLKGIFLDEASNLKGDIPYYQSLYNYITAKSGYVHDILNPGASTDQGYLAASSSIVVYEDSASGYKNPTASWIKCAPSASEKAGYKYRFSGIAYGASASQMATIASEMAGAGIGMVYITDKTLPNPYDPIPSYWTTLASTVKAL